MDADDIFEDMLNILNRSCDSSSSGSHKFIIFPDLTQDNSKEELNFGVLSNSKEKSSKKRKRCRGHVISREEKKKVEAERRAKNKELLTEAKTELEKRGLLAGLEALKSSKSRYSVEKIHILNRLTKLVEKYSTSNNY